MLSNKSHAYEIVYILFILTAIVYFYAIYFAGDKTLRADSMDTTMDLSQDDFRNNTGQETIKMSTRTQYEFQAMAE